MRVSRYVAAAAAVALLTRQPRAARTPDLPLVYAPGPAGFTR